MFNEAYEKLKTHGVRMTPQRYAILSYLLQERSHPTADDIYRAIADRFPNISVATVYNNLKMFNEAGLIRELTYGDASSRFDGDTTDHYHAICETCGKIADFDFPSLTAIEQAATAQTSYQIRSHRLEVYGTCSNCSAHQLH
jgi:Fur family peroxide stress response transcriptional regulator